MGDKKGCSQAPSPATKVHLLCPTPFGFVADRGQQSLYLLTDLLKGGEIVKRKTLNGFYSQGRLYRGGECLEELDMRTQRKLEE